MSTRFKKDELHWLTEHVIQLDEFVLVPQNSTRDSGKFYQFHREELVILMKGSTTKTHLDMALDSKFGGSAIRWAMGYRWLMFYLKDKFFHLIGPEAIKIWVPCFPTFVHGIYDYVKKPKVRTDQNGVRRKLRWNHADAPGRDELNIFGHLDGIVYDCSRTGTDSALRGDDARRLGSRFAQPLFCYEHNANDDIRILSIYLPNGMVGAIYSPCSSDRELNPTLVDWSHYDNRLRDLCVEHFGVDRIYACYADAIYQGRWHCVRTRHEPLSELNMCLTPGQENENENLKCVCKLLEHCYKFALAKFPAIECKESNKRMLVAKVHVFHFLSNVLVCLRGGNICTSDRSFGVAPPSVEDYLNGTPCANLAH